MKKYILGLFIFGSIKCADPNPIVNYNSENDSDDNSSEYDSDWDVSEHYSENISELPKWKIIAIMGKAIVIKDQQKIKESLSELLKKDYFDVDLFIELLKHINKLSPRLVEKVLNSLKKYALSTLYTSIDNHSKYAYDNLSREIKLLTKIIKDDNQLFKNLSLIKLCKQFDVRYANDIFELIFLLIKSDININQIDQNNNSSLIYLCSILTDLDHSNKKKKDKFSETIPLIKKAIYLLLFHDADIIITNNDHISFFTYLEEPEILKIASEFVIDILNKNNLNEAKGTQNALLLTAYLNISGGIQQLLEKGVWFNSEKYELYFNNLIADKREMYEIIKNYKNEVAQQIYTRTELIPDIANIIAEY